MGLYESTFGTGRRVGDYARKHLYYCDRAGYIRDNPEFVVDRKSVDDYLIVYVVSGILHMEMGGGGKPLRSGDTAVIPLQKPHRYYSDRESPCEILWMDFNCTEEKILPLTAIGELPVVCRCPDHFELINRFVYQFVNKSLFTEIRQSQLLYRILLSAVESLGEGERAGRPFMPEVENYINEHIGGKMTLEQLSAVVHISRDRFSHLFRAQYGISPIRYVLEKKMDRAVYLLAYSSLTVTEIAERLGFYSQSHFSALFRKHTGVYPSRWRQKNSQRLYPRVSQDTTSSS